MHPTMNCPICHKALEPTADTSYDRRDPANVKEYDRTTYHCPQDNTWITVEIPRIVEATSSRAMGK